MKIFESIFHFLCLIAVIVATPFSSIPRDVSSDPQYAEIYHQTFEVQNPLFLKRSSETKTLYLDKNGDFAKIEKGTRLRVKKVTKSHGFATTNVRVLVTIDGPHFSTYKDIEADRLIIKGHTLSYSNDLVQFDPNYLKNIEVKTLHRAIQYEDLDAVKRLTVSGLNQKNLDGMTPLHYARRPDIAEYLLENGADPNVTDKWGKTLLHYAAQDNLYDIVTLLVANGALIDQKDNEENTPLLIAAEANHFDIVLYLLKSGSDPLIKGQYQRTVLLSAAHHDRPDIAELALKLGADPLAICELSKMSGILYAAQNNNLRMAKLFIEAGAPVNCANNRLETPLHYASRNLPMLQYLIANGADIQRMNSNERTVLHEACRWNDLGLIRFLCEKGAQINHGDRFGQSPFFEAINTAGRYENIEIIKWLTEHGADLCQADKEGTTPLHYALHLALDSKILSRMIKWLLENGARADQPDNNGVTPLNLAKKYEHQGKGMKYIIKLLENNTAR